MFDVNGKTAIVTGAAHGIGLDTARTLLSKGANVVIADYDENALKIEAEKLASEYGDKIALYTVDISDKEAVTAMVDFTVEKYGELNIMVANAGVAPSDHPYGENFYEKAISINQHGTYYCDIASSKQMMEQGKGGAIVNVSSIMGLVAASTASSYGISKWAVRGMTKSLAVELAPYNIRVNGIHPGYIITNMINETTMGGKETIEYLKSLHPLSAAIDRLGAPEEITSAIMLAIENTFMTGSEIVVDGGYTSV